MKYKPQGKVIEHMRPAPDGKVLFRFVNGRGVASATEYTFIETDKGDVVVYVVSNGGCSLYESSKDELSMLKQNVKDGE